MMALLAAIDSTNFISTIPNPHHRMTFMLHHGTGLLRNLIARLDARSADLNFEHLLEDSGPAVAAPTTSPSTTAIEGPQKTSTTNDDAATANPPFNDACARDLRAAHDVMRQALWTLEELETPEAGPGLDAAALDEAKTGVDEMAKLLFCAEEMMGGIEVKCQGLREQVFNAGEGSC